MFASLTRPASGVLLAVPIPEGDELDAEHLDRVLDDALADCAAAGHHRCRITPFVLGRIAEATDGRSIPANLALAENNARVAAEVAVAIAALTRAFRAMPAGDPPRQRRRVRSRHRRRVRP